MTKAVLEILQERGYEAKTQKAVRGGVTLEAIAMFTGKGVGITFYPTKMRGTAEDIADEIIKIFEKEKNDVPKFDVSNITDWEYVKDKLMVCLRPVVENSNHLTKEFLDLQMIVRVKVGFQMTALVTEELSKNWGKTVDEIFEQAIANGDDYTVRNMADVILGELPEEIRAEVAPHYPMFVVSNESNWYGAGALLQENLLEKIAQETNSDYLYIIPSSIHEVIVFATEGLDKDEADAMVQDVNDTQVKPEEVLGNHIYIFNRETGAITY